MLPTSNSSTNMDIWMTFTFPRRRGAGGRSGPRAFSRRGARRSLRLPKPIGESRGAVPPHPPPPSFGVISADGKLSSVWQTWCLRSRSRFALGLFCFWRNYGAGRLHKLGAFTIECQKKNFFFSFGSGLVFHISLKQNKTNKPKKKNPHHKAHVCTHTRDYYA